MFGIENVFTFVLNFFFFRIWIGNESEDRVSPDIVWICQSGRVWVGYRVRSGSYRESAITDSNLIRDTSEKMGMI